MKKYYTEITSLDVLYWNETENRDKVNDLGSSGFVHKSKQKPNVHSLIMIVSAENTWIKIKIFCSTKKSGL